MASTAAKMLASRAWATICRTSASSMARPEQYRESFSSSRSSAQRSLSRRPARADTACGAMDAPFSSARFLIQTARASRVGAARAWTSERGWRTRSRGLFRGNLPVGEKKDGGLRHIGIHVRQRRPFPDAPLGLPSASRAAPSPALPGLEGPQQTINDDDPLGVEEGHDVAQPHQLGGIGLGWQPAAAGWRRAAGTRQAQPRPP